MKVLRILNEVNDYGKKKLLYMKQWTEAEIDEAFLLEPTNSSSNTIQEPVVPVLNQTFQVNTLNTSIPLQNQQTNVSSVTNTDQNTIQTSVV